MFRSFPAAVLAFFLLVSPTFSFSAEQPPSEPPSPSVWKGFGLFGSLDDDTDAGKYYQYEAFAILRMPWRWKLGKGVFEPLVFAGGGWYNQADDTLEYFTVGPVLQIGRKDFPLTLELGVRPGWLLDYQSPGRNFGGNFTFFDHVGLLFKPTQSLSLGYRFQHMSNASIYDRNPGINMHLLDLRLEF